MRALEKDRLAAEVADRWVDFEMALSDKRKYPVQQFRQFWEVGRRYAELTKGDPLIHRSVVEAVYGLTDFVMAERKRVPEQIVRDAQRLESLVFDGAIHISRGANRLACRPVGNVSRVTT